jgi:hypothetical protein
MDNRDLLAQLEDEYPDQPGDDSLDRLYNQMKRDEVTP